MVIGLFSDNLFLFGIFLILNKFNLYSIYILNCMIMKENKCKNENLFYIFKLIICICFIYFCECYM